MKQGTVSTLPVYATVSGTSSGVSYEGTAAQTAGIELTATIPKLKINNASGLTINKNVTLTDGSAALTLTTGIISMGGGFGLTLGDGTVSNPTSPAGSSSSFVNISAANSFFSLYSGTGGSRSFPVGISTATTGERRISFTSLTSAGTIKVEYDVSGGGSVSPGFTNFLTTNRFKLSVSSGTFTSFGGMTIVYGNENTITGFTTADLRIVNSATIGGTYGIVALASNYTTNSSTQVAATSLGVNFTSLGYFAVAADVPSNFSGAVDNNWSNAGNWSAGVPTSGQRAVIPTTKTVNLDGGGTYAAAALDIVGTVLGNSPATLSVGGNVTLTTSGALNMSDGTLNIGNTCGDSKQLSVNTGCTLTMSGAGTIKLGGNARILTGSTFNMSGTSVFKIDPNGGSAATSPTSSFGAFEMATGTGTVNGGTIKIIDIPYVSPFSATFQYTGTAFMNWAGNKVIMGDISNTEGCQNTATGTAGMEFRCNANLLFGDVDIDAGNTSANYAAITSQAAPVYIGGKLTIKSGSELKTYNSGATLSVAGDLQNDGKLTQQGTGALRLETLSAGVAAASTNAQTISGSGTFANLTTSPTAGLANLVVNNSNAAGVTLNTTIPLSISGTLTLTSGKVNLGVNNFTLISGAAISGATSAKYIVTNGAGKLQINSLSTSTATTFPIGTSTSSYDPCTIKPTNSSINFSVNVGTTISGSPLMPSLVAPRQWDITPSATPGATALTMTTTAYSPSTYSIGHYNGASWEEFKYVTFASNTWSLTQYNGTFSPFGVGETGAFASVALAVDFTAISATNKGATNLVTFTTVNEKDLTGFQIERSATGTQCSSIGEVKAKGASTYTFVDANPLTVSYYRVRGVELSGKSIVSKIVSVNTGKAKLTLLNVYPSPTKNNLTIDFDAVANSNITVSIKDITGRFVLTKNVKGTEGSHNLTLDVSNLSNGVYIMSINDNVSSIVKRIVKQ